MVNQWFSVCSCISVKKSQLMVSQWYLCAFQVRHLCTLGTFLFCKYCIFYITDTDECTDGSICGVSQCINMPGSYSCQCNTGMDFDPNSLSCISKFNFSMDFDPKSLSCISKGWTLIPIYCPVSVRDGLWYQSIVLYQ